jgi:periplasmic divalent cation tolerance protein
MTDKVIVLTTCSSAEQAGSIARRLVEARLAACVSVVPGARSYYRWQGAIESSEEHLLLIKSSRELAGELQQEIGKLHSYELPEFLVLPIVDGSENYLDWLGRELRSI